MRRKNDAPHEISETGKRDQRDGQVEQIAGLRFGLASLVEHAAVQQFVQRAAAARGIEHAIQGVQPHRRLEFHFAENRLQTLGHIGEVGVVVVQFGGRALAEILHQQEIDLVAHGIGFRGLRQKVLQQQDQAFGIHQRTGLQKLAQLVNLDFLVHVVQPLLSLLDGFWRRRFPRRPQDRHRQARRLRTRAPVRRKWDAGGERSTTGPRDLELVPKVATTKVAIASWFHDPVGN